MIVLMTMPPKEGEHTQAVLEVHHETKAAFTECKSLAIVTSICLDALKDLPDMNDEQYKILQLFLTFVRNLMLIPDSKDQEIGVAKHHFATLRVSSLPSHVHMRTTGFRTVTETELTVTCRLISSKQL